MSAELPTGSVIFQQTLRKLRFSDRCHFICSKFSCLKKANTAVSKFYVFNCLKTSVFVFWQILYLSLRWQNLCGSVSTVPVCRPFLAS